MDFKEWNKQIIAEFREKGGESDQFPPGSLVLVHNRGAKSGEERTNPLMHIRDDGRIILVASMAGADRNPDWYYNLKANPEVTIETGKGTHRGRAEEVTGEERDRLYEAVAAKYPQFDEYRHKTSRKIPVLAVTLQD
jgi:deazaflavin-dependent oxidoreductase (nitroreductase family)